MDTIKNYLDNMFAQMTQNSEIQKAKTEMLQMMEDKYNELKAEGKSENEAIGIVISEFGNIDEIFDALEIKKEGKVNISKEATDNSDKAGTQSGTKKVSKEEAIDYIKATQFGAKFIYLGVFLCICSPIMIILAGEGHSVAGMLLGLICLFVLIAVAVVLFIQSGVKLSKFEHLKKDEFQLDPETESMTRKLAAQARSTFGRNLAMGVACCIVAVIPVLATGILFGNNDFIQCTGVGVMFLIVAIGVRLIVSTAISVGCYKVLLQENEYAPQVKEDKTMSIVSGIYWPVITAVYLLVSFLTGRWDITWIVWPVAGALFGAIAAITSAIRKNRV